MSQLRLSGFTLVGDSNVRRNMTSSVTADRPLMSDAQVLPSGRMSSFAVTLEATRPESNACVVSCISNFLSTSAPSTTPNARVEKVTTDFFAKIRAFALTRPDLMIFVCPPMYRTSPLWYRDALPDILLKFSEIGSSGTCSNVHLMPSFTRSVLEPDGVHLTPFSGMEYVLHLFKASEAIIQKLDQPVEARVGALSEETRSLHDRVHVLELDRRRLSDKVDHREAVDSELRDFEENLRNEAFIMVCGLPRLPRLDPKEWQARAIADVAKILAIMGFDYPIKFIQNATGRGKNSVVLYKVRLESVEASKSVRDKFSTFFHDNRDSRPPELSQVSIRNCVTTATLGRIAILQMFGRRYTASNSGSRFTVIGYEARPLLKIFPAPTATDKRVMTFNFIEAISKLPTCFTAEEKSELLKRISPRLHSCLKEIFVVVSQDSLRRQGGQKRRPVDSPGSSGQSSSHVNTSGSETSPILTPGRKRVSRKRGAPAPGGGPAKR